MSSGRVASSWVPSAVQQLIRWRWGVIVLVLSLSVLVASGGRHLRFSGDYRVFFSKDNPLLASFEELQNTYVKNESILFVLAPRGGDVFTAPTLAAVETLTERAWKIPFSTRVDSLTNFQHTRAEGDELIVRDLVEGAAELAPEQLAEMRRVALAEPRLVRRLVSPSGHVTAVNVLVQFEDKSPDRLAEAVSAARELAQQLRREHPDVEVHLSGAVMLHNAFMEATQHDLATLVPLMFLGIIAVMLFFLRSWSATLATVMVIVLSAMIAMGAAGWLGVALTPVSAVAPTLILTLAVADSIHVLMSFFSQRRRGLASHAAIVESIRLNFQPIFLTCFTTVIGFLSMNTSDVPPLRDLGNVTAIGVTAAFLLSMTLLPALMAVLPMRESKAIRSEGWSLRPVADFVIAHHRKLLWSTAAVVLLLGAFVPANDLNENTVRYFDESVDFRRDTDFVVANLSGILQVEFSLAASEAGGITDPTYLATLDEFAAWWRQQPEVVHVDTVSDVFKQLNKSLHGDDPAAYRLPASRELAAQYLLLYELSLPYGLDLNNQVNVDKSASRFSVTLEEVSSREIIEIAARGEQWLREHAPQSMSVSGIGPTVMFAHLAIRNIKSMAWGSLLAFGLISLTLIFALRSLKLGVISLIPNMIPAILGFGIWGLCVGEVGFLLSIVLAMTLGIVDDDTVHFLSKYLRLRREQGLGPEAAVRHALDSVGRETVAASVILIGGFAILSLSSFAQNSDMGRLSALIIVLAVLTDCLLLPPLLLWLDGVREESETRITTPNIIDVSGDPA